MAEDWEEFTVWVVAAVWAVAREGIVERRRRRAVDDVDGNIVVIVIIIVLVGLNVFFIMARKRTR